RAWFHALANRSYRPGVYCHSGPAKMLRQLWPDLFVWSVRYPSKYNNPVGVDLTTPPPFQISTPAVDESGDLAAIDWQYCNFKARRWTKVDPTSGVPAQDRSKISIELDFNTSNVADPLFPEIALDPGLVRLGRSAGLVSDATSADLFLVRRGRVQQMA